MWGGGVIGFSLTLPDSFHSSHVQRDAFVPLLCGSVGCGNEAQPLEVCRSLGSIPATGLSSAPMCYLSVAPSGCLWGMKASLPLRSFMKNSDLLEGKHGNSSEAPVAPPIHACLQQRADYGGVQSNEKEPEWRVQSPPPTLPGGEDCRRPPDPSGGHTKMGSRH